MPDPSETRLLADRHGHNNPSYTDGNEAGVIVPSQPHGEPYPPPANLNYMKRNMFIARGFMDVSLLTANASQLRSLLAFGDRETSAYYVILTGLVLSLILQFATGILLIVKERFDLDLEDDQDAAELYNNITVFMVFLTLLINVFVSSFGISVYKGEHTPYDQAVLQNKAAEGRAITPLPEVGHPTIPLDVEIMNLTLRRPQL